MANILKSRIRHKIIDTRCALTALGSKNRFLPLLTNVKFEVYNINAKFNKGGTLAQLGERHTHIVEATGSSPVGPTSEI